MPHASTRAFASSKVPFVHTMMSAVVPVLPTLSTSRTAISAEVEVVGFLAACCLSANLTRLDRVMLSARRALFRKTAPSFIAAAALFPAVLEPNPLRRRPLCVVSQVEKYQRKLAAATPSARWSS